MLVLLALGCTTLPTTLEEGPRSPTPEAQECALPTGRVPLGQVVRAAEGNQPCEIVVAGCLGEACPPFETTLSRVGFDGLEIERLSERTRRWWIIGSTLAYLESTGDLWLRPANAEATLLATGIVGGEVAGDRLILIDEGEGIASFDLFGSDPVALSDRGIVLGLVPEPPSVLLLETEPWDAPDCNQGTRGDLLWVDASSGERRPIATDVTHLYGELSNGRIAYETRAADGSRTAWVVDRELLEDPQAFRTLDPWFIPDFGGCAGDQLTLLRSPDDTHIAYRQTHITIEPNGLGGVYPNLQLEIVPTNAVHTPPQLISCEPVDQPELLDDGLLCGTDGGLVHTDFAGAVTVLETHTGRVVPVAEREWIVQVYDDTLPLVDGLFRSSSVWRITWEVGEDPVRTWLADGYLEDVQDDRWATVSDLPGAWLWPTPDAIGWRTLDLHTGEDFAWETALRPAQVMDEGQITLQAPWGSSNHSPRSLFIAPGPTTL